MNWFSADIGVFEIGHCSLGKASGHGNSWAQMVEKPQKTLGFESSKVAELQLWGWNWSLPQVVPPVSLTKFLPLLS